MLNPRAAGPEASLIEIPGSNQGGNNLTLKGWPLHGLDQLRSGFLQQQKPFIQAPQPFYQIQMLTPQRQQQLMLAQQSLTSPSATDENRRLRMLYNNRNMGLGKDGLTNPGVDVVPNVGSPLQAGGSLMSRGDTDILLKIRMAQMHQQQQQQQNSNPQQQQLQQHTLSNQQSQNSNHNIHQQDKMGGAGGVTVGGSMSNSFRGNDQVLDACLRALCGFRGTEDLADKLLDTPFISDCIRIKRLSVAPSYEQESAVDNKEEPKAFEPGCKHW